MFEKLFEKFGYVRKQPYENAVDRIEGMFNIICTNLFDSNITMPVTKKLCELLVWLDLEGIVLINDLLEDWKNPKEFFEPAYKKRLNVICPIIVKYQKQIEKAAEAYNTEAGKIED